MWIPRIRIPNNRSNTLRLENLDKSYRMEIEFERSPEDCAENLLYVLVSQLGEDDGDREHGEAGVVLEPVPLVPRRQATQY
jgi:hypothetical protein